MAGTPLQQQQEGDHHHLIIVCAVCAALFATSCAVSTALLSLVNWRPWRLYSYLVIQKWPGWIKDHDLLSMLSGFLSLIAWLMVLSPVLVLIAWGINLVLLLEQVTIGLAIIMPGTALLFSFYAIMLWWRTRWQSSRVVAVLILVAVCLLSAYEISAVYITSGRSASNHFSTSGFFFGISAITLAINMLFICKMAYNGLDLDEYVRRLYKYANTECVDIAPVTGLPEAPNSKDSLMLKQSKVFHPIILYLGSMVVLLLYSIFYALAAENARWLGGVTAAAVILFDSSVGACIFGFEILKDPTTALFIAGTYRIFLICFGVHYWFLGHCIGYAVVASLLIGAAVTRRFAASDSLSETKVFLESARVRLREGFRRKGPGSCSSFSEGHASSIKRSSSIDPIMLGTSRAASLRHAHGTEENTEGGGLNSAASVDSGRPSIVLHSSSCASIVQEADGGLISSGRYEEKIRMDAKRLLASGSSHVLVERNHMSVDMRDLDSISMSACDRRFSSLGRYGVSHGGEQELTTLFQDKGLDPNFAVMYEETGINPPLLELLQRTSLDADRDQQDNNGLQAGSMPAEISSVAKQLLFTKQLQNIRSVLKFLAGTPERAWVLLSLIFISDLVVVAVLHPKNITSSSSSREQLVFGVSALLIPPVLSSIFAFSLSATSENPRRRSRSWKWGFFAWLLSTSSGVLLSFLSNSSVLLGCSITFPSIVACLSVLIPIWRSNGYRFYIVPPDELLRATSSNQQGCLGSKEGMKMTGCILGLMTCVVGLGIAISLRPWDRLGYYVWSDDSSNSGASPYTSSIYLGWAIASAVALLITGVLPAVSWFATYRFSLSSAVCVGIFVVILVVFCGGSYLGVVQSRDGQIPIKADFLAALLPLVCIPAVFILFCGLYKWKDEGWKLSRGVCIFLGIGLLLLIGAISAIIVTIDPWMVGVAFLLFLLLLTLAISVIHYWVLHNFYLTWTEMMLVGLAVLVLAFAAFLVGLLSEEPFAGASVGFFSLLFILAGRALAALLSPPVVIYSPRVLPVYVYDAHADCAKNRSGAFIALYGVAVASILWGVVASLEIYPPYAGVTVSAVTLVVGFGFAVSRPTCTMKMVEGAVQFLSKETVIQAIARSATKTRNALSGAYSAPQRSASSTALLVGDPKLGRDKGGNYVLPREDVSNLQDRLRNQELAARLWWGKRKPMFAYHHELSSEAQVNARIFLLEEALDTEWVYMWDKFGGYLLLLLCLAAKAERVQDEVRLRLFLDSKGFSDLSNMKMKKWRPQDYKEFELMQESFIREKEMEDELILQRREEEGRGKERRKLLLERGEQRRREVEAAALSSMNYVGIKEVAAVAAAAHAVACDVLFDEAKAVEQVLSIAQRILLRQKAERALQTNVSGAVCIIDNEPRNDGGLYGVIESSVCGSACITFSAAIHVEVGSGPVCLLGTETSNEACLEIFIAGSDDAFEGGQIGVRVVMKGARQTTVCSGWNLGSQNLADGRWHNVAVTIDGTIGEARSFLDGMPDEPVDGLLLPFHNGIWKEETEVWIGAKPPMDLNAFGRSDSEGAEGRLQIMDVFVWGSCLTAEEIETVHNSSRIDEFSADDESFEEDWQYDDPPSRGGNSSIEAANLDEFVREEAFSDDHFPSGRKRKSEKEVAVEIDYISRIQRRPKLETPEEVLQRMQAVELAVREDLASRRDTHFTDQEFPPTNQSLFIDPDEPSQKIQVVKEWMRPRELVSVRCRDREPCLFAGTADASDVCQGRLGNCWFLSAVAVLTEARCISEVIITPRYNEEGIYTVRFCIQGEWVPVVVDDWIPCEYGGKPAFASSRKGNELWVSILEKAYAKLHGSYEALEGGVVQDALVDLTGGAGEEIDMRSAQAQIDIASGRLWSQLLRFKQEGFLLGAGSPSGSDSSVSSSGIVQGHAYSLLQVREVDGHKLVQIRNPWANEVEWNGPWSDSALEWTDRIKHKLKYLPQAQDGVFWMSWQDFQLHFCSIYICRVYPPEMRNSIQGRWLGCTAGGCQHYYTWHQNPQYLLKAVGPDSRYPIHVFVTLAQGARFVSKRRSAFDNYQSSGDTTKFYIGMRILQTQGHRAKHNIYMHESVGGTDYVNSREISFEMVLEPDPKGYTIVPSTLYPGEEAPFVLSVYTKASIILEAI